MSEFTYDLLVIGGGIYGCAIAYDASLRGIKTALVEQNDFGSGASSGCFKIIHGGVRYLQHFDIPRLIESVSEQRTLRIIAPHLVRPLPFIVPCYGSGRRGRAFLSCGMTLYDLLACWRNAGVCNENHLERFRWLEKSDLLSIAPPLQSTQLSGGIVYHDAIMKNCERLTYSIAKSAEKSKADIFNYMEVCSSQIESGPGGKQSIKAVECRDKRTGQKRIINARCIVNAAGPWIDSVLGVIAPGSEWLPSDQYYSVGIQVVLPEIVSSYAIAVESSFRDGAATIARGGRSFFLVPWSGSTIVGTSDRIFRGRPSDYRLEADEVRQFISDVSSTFASPLIDFSKIRFVFGGLRPVEPQILNALRRGQSFHDGDAAVARDHVIVDHAVSSGPANLLSATGVKYTTFRSLAEQVVNSVAGKLGRINGGACVLGRCRTKDLPVYGAEEGFDPDSSFSDVPLDVRSRLFEHYGAVSQDMLFLRDREGEQLKYLMNTRITEYEIRYLVRHEHVYSLSDLLLRRMSICSTGMPRLDIVSSAATVVASELGWSESRTREEIEGFCNRFTLYPMDLVG